MEAESVLATGNGLPQARAAGSIWSAVRAWRALAVRALQRMYRPEQQLFAFRLAPQTDGQLALQGVSGRYTAIALIALADQEAPVVGKVLGGHSLEQVCNTLIQRAETSDDLGEVALTLWAARRLEHPWAARALECFRAMDPARRLCPTVELSWCLTALSVPSREPTSRPLAASISMRLLTADCERSGLFAHWPADVKTAWLRRHVCCFADLVYPIQALASYAALGGGARVLKVAERTAQRMCELQGPQGQWWWHYDARSGRVVERFPVYSVHQDAMGPMALLALEEAGGPAHHDAIARSVRWLIAPPEARQPLVDMQADVIWRKVSRHEPGKLARQLQATASRVHPWLRVPGVDFVLRPGWIDFETRPYHMAWLLHAFSPERLQRLSTGLQPTSGAGATAA